MRKYNLSFKRVYVSTSNKVEVDSPSVDYMTQLASYIKTLLLNRGATEKQIQKLFSDISMTEEKQIIWIQANRTGGNIAILEISDENGITQNSNV